VVSDSDVDGMGEGGVHERPGPWSASSGPTPDEVPDAQTAAQGDETGPHLEQPSGGWETQRAQDWERSPQSGPASENRPPRRGRTALAAALAALVLLTGGIGIGWGLRRSDNGGPASASLAPLMTAPRDGSSTGRADQGLDVQAIAQRVDPAVVDVNTVADAFGRRAEGAGTGMVVTSSGEVLTNNHVVDGATRIAVSIPGRSGSYAARVIGVDISADVALLQIQGLSNLPTVTLADSSSLAIGQEVVAIGNALGQGGSPTVTEGTVSALGRSIAVGDDRGGSEHLRGLIQTDAPIQPGDSGGPLVNSAGQVVGMLTAASRGGFAQPGSSVGFAIPSNDALSIVNEIRSGHPSSSIIIGQAGFLGIGVRDLDPATAARLGLNVTSGALVLSVSPGTPAARAGISRGAVITAVDGERIASADALGLAIHRHKPGEQIGVTWIDQNGTHTVAVHLIAGPAV
jgi:S1-C subfamily serine protease